MKRQRISNEQLDQLGVALLQAAAKDQPENTDSSSPYFMSRLRVRINEEQQTPVFWETGILAARNWLFGFSAVALIFFISSVWSVQNLSWQANINRGELSETVLFPAEEVSVLERLNDDSPSSSEEQK